MRSRGQTPIQSDGCLYKKRLGQRHAQRDGDVRTQEKTTSQGGKPQESQTRPHLALRLPASQMGRESCSVVGATGLRDLFAVVAELRAQMSYRSSQRAFAKSSRGPRAALRVPTLSSAVPGQQVLWVSFGTDELSEAQRGSLLS